MLTLYITSSIREEGKTFLATGVAATMQSLGYSTALYKPVQTKGIENNGFIQSPDMTKVNTVDPYINASFSYLFKSDEEPLIAAENENEYIDIEVINKDCKKIITSHDCTVIDGECGLFSPLTADMLNIDLIKDMNIPVVFSVIPNKSAVNYTLSSINAAIFKGIDVKGVVINNIPSNCPKKLLTSVTRLIEEYSDAKILGLIPTLAKDFTPQDLIAAILNGVDVESLFDVKIEKLEF